MLLHGKKIYLFGKSDEKKFPKKSIQAMIKDLGGAVVANDTSCDYVISGEPMPADEKRKAPVVSAKVWYRRLLLHPLSFTNIALLVVVRRHWKLRVARSQRRRVRSQGRKEGEVDSPLVWKAFQCIKTVYCLYNIM